MTSWRLQRIILGYRLADVARASRLSQARLSRIERGLAAPKRDESDRLTETLGSLGGKPQDNARIQRAVATERRQPEAAR